MFDIWNVIRQILKLQFDHIFFVLCGQIFAGMPKVL